MSDVSFGSEIHRVYDMDQLISMAQYLTFEQFERQVKSKLSDASELSTNQIDNGDYKGIYDSYKE